MDITFLKALYYLCSCPQRDELGRAKTVGVLYERYLSLTETERAANALYLALGPDRAEGLDELVGALRDAEELQGFVNGFRYGAMLAGELAGDFPRQLWSPDTARDLQPT